MHVLPRGILFPANSQDAAHNTGKSRGARKDLPDPLSSARSDRLQEVTVRDSQGYPAHPATRSAVFHLRRCPRSI